MIEQITTVRCVVSNYCPQANRQQPETDEEAFERKEREKRLQIESDIQNASDLFSGVAVDGK